MLMSRERTQSRYARPPSVPPFVPLSSPYHLILYAMSPHGEKEKEKRSTHPPPPSIFFLHPFLLSSLAAVPRS